MTDTVTIPGYKAGTWVIDPTHSEVAFSVRHLMISKVKGKFERFTATFTTGENPLDSKVEATAEVASVNTNEPNRDGHLRTGDFFEAEKYPEIHFVSTAVRPNGDDFLVDGELTIKGTTKPVTFEVEFGGFGTDPYGNYKAGLTAKATIDRTDFGLTYNAALETGGVLIGEKVTITLDLQAAHQA
ncbi:polyisoprenoid-binding protein [Rathayibacter sp. AY1G1]|jgi:polyisoprenoid-binding protein YceI|uniref:YceI family protein n=1 Tax=unclassified Rathayibacter TaxID=2609250 RepID=UPI000CE85B55|nr:MULTISPECIES: YceI family protein [unclassified Rathayibacter]PPF12904.1 polyisoprenoid-binding protein [Rathayibacter sp. AY1A5]PPF22567.1 polyisoprenoid-binding protein [Rathayibacter sp. AY1A7]PPF30062.1 polyisoprenoid-binding protein [Rathayibacter sp. AY1F2]PPF30716.1 polyisoprenoid-binding protein [Rathayibacter sp. AY1A3]PPF49069.1 polyisoprenoid-binding protein [Rathayibacter sp. AY1A1]